MNRPPERESQPEPENAGRGEPPLWVKIIIVGCAAMIVTFLIFCLGLILLWAAQGLWSILFG